MTRTMAEVYAALYRERNGDPDQLAAERHAPEPAPPPRRRRPAEYLPVPELTARRNLQTLADALDGTTHEGAWNRGAA